MKRARTRERDWNDKYSEGVAEQNAEAFCEVTDSLQQVRKEKEISKIKKREKGYKESACSSVD